jgi:dTDP-4-dehydrorhamnose reductase
LTLAKIHANMKIISREVRMDGRKKVLLTGGCGFVGGNIVEQAQARHDLQLFAVDNRLIPSNFSNVSWHALDLRDQAQLKDLFGRIAPDVVIHTAAMSDIDFCEKNRQVAREINIGVTESLAKLAGSHGSRFIWYSSDTIFDGTKGNYREEDPPNPLNYYAETKVQAEKIVSGLGKNWVIIRPSLVVGFPVWEQGNSFLWRTLHALKEGKQAAFPSKEIRTPMDVITLSRATLELATLDFSGVLHVAGNTVIDRFSMAQKLAVALGYGKELIIDQSMEAAAGRAARAPDASLCNDKAKRVLRTRLLDLDGEIKLILENRRMTR